MSDSDWEAMFLADQSAADLVFGALIGSVLGLTLTNKGVANNDYGSLGLTLITLSGFAYAINAVRAYAFRRQWNGVVYNLVPGFGLPIITSFFLSKIGVDGKLVLITLYVWLLVTLLDVGGRVLTRRLAEGQGND